MITAKQLAEALKNGADGYHHVAYPNNRMAFFGPINLEAVVAELNKVVEDEARTRR